MTFIFRLETLETPQNQEKTTAISFDTSASDKISSTPEIPVEQTDKHMSERKGESDIKQISETNVFLDKTPDQTIKKIDEQISPETSATDASFAMDSGGLEQGLKSATNEFEVSSSFSEKWVDPEAKGSDSDSANLSEGSAGKVQRSESERKRRKDKSAVRKSSLNLPSSEEQGDGKSNNYYLFINISAVITTHLKLTCHHINRRHFCFNIKSISVHPLLWMNVMIDFISMVFAGM